MTTRPYLVFGSVGPRSKHRTHWLRQAEERRFDLVLCDYSARPGAFRGDADRYVERRGGKLENAAACGGARWLDYRYLLLLDDDIEIDTRGLNDLFAHCEREGLHLAQPAFTGDSVVSHRFSIAQPASVVRQVPFVEVGVPVFSRWAYSVCRQTFALTVSGFGQDLVWPKLIADPSKIAVVDAVTCRHPARPADDRTGIDGLIPRDAHYREAKAMLRTYGVSLAAELPPSEPPLNRSGRGGGVR